MGSLSDICFVLGVGLAIGMLAGTTGTHGSARGRMTLLAAAIGCAVGALLAGTADLDLAVSAFFCLLGAVTACVVVPLVGVLRGQPAREMLVHGLTLAFATNRGLATSLP